MHLAFKIVIKVNKNIIIPGSYNARQPVKTT